MQHQAIDAFIGSTGSSLPNDSTEVTGLEAAGKYQAKCSAGYAVINQWKPGVRTKYYPDRRYPRSERSALILISSQPDFAADYFIVTNAVLLAKRIRKDICLWGNSRRQVVIASMLE